MKKKLFDLPYALNDLKSVNQWVTYQAKWDAEKEKFNKIPKSPHDNLGAKSDDPTTWGTYEEACEALYKYNVTGLGFELANGFLGVDLDNCLDKDGKTNPTARAIVKMLNSYTEISPSGKGLHILLRYEHDEKIGRRNDKIGLEIYNHGRFFTITGKVYGEPQMICERSSELDAVVRQYLPPKRAKAKNYPDQYEPNPKFLALAKLSDDDLIARIKLSHQSDKFTRLYEHGDLSAYDNDHSRADQALADILCFWTLGDAKRMDRMFRASALCRPKWDELRGEKTYGERTIQKALDHVELPQNQYSPPSDSKSREEPDAWNINRLNEPRACFVVEGHENAELLENEGSHAMALEGTNNRAELEKILQKIKPTATIILMLNYDKAYRARLNDFEETLRRFNAPFIVADFTHGAYNVDDPRTGLKRQAQTACEMHKADGYLFLDEICKNEQRADQLDPKEEYFKTSAINSLDRFRELSEEMDAKFIPTGFKMLDDRIEGLGEGKLYTIGAITSLGKTTFILQMADQIAQQGYDILYIALEMGKNELIAKSISRESMLYNLENLGYWDPSVSAQEVTTRKLRESLNTKQKEALEHAFDRYAQYANHIYIKEGISDIGIKQIKQYIEDHISYTGNKPVVIIDYLQILSPFSERMTDKQNTDRNIVELKRIARDYKIPVVAISSFNRGGGSEHDNGLVKKEAFKETGLIEYQSDMLIGLEFLNAGKMGYSESKEKNSIPRRIAFKVLKSRYGPDGYMSGFSYFQEFNYWMEDDYRQHHWYLDPNRNQEKLESKSDRYAIKKPPFDEDDADDEDDAS